jgi:hypothetical protein
MRSALIAVVLLCISGFAQTTSSKPTTSFSGLNFLVGGWAGTGSGDPGKGTGGFTFKPQLNGHVLVRDNFAEYPAADGRPAFRHEDHMDVFEEAGKLHALYLDSEGHVIQYGVSSTSDTAVFLSEGDGPRYRLTYHVLDPKRVSIKFEVAPPGAEFKTYIDATAQRK